MGNLTTDGDYIIKLGASKATGDKIMFIDFGEDEGSRCYASATGKLIGNVVSYTGHVVKTHGVHKSPDVFPVRFAVKVSDDPGLPQACLISASAYVLNKMVMAGWDGVEEAFMPDSSNSIDFIKNFSSSEKSEGAGSVVNKNVIRTRVSPEMFLPEQNRTMRTLKNKLKKGVFPNIKRLGVVLGEPLPAIESGQVVKKTAGVADKVGFGPVMVPVIDEEASKQRLRGVFNASVASFDYYGGLGVYDETVFNDRGQAANAVPLLAGMISESPTLTRIIDNREPLHPVLMEMTGLSKGAMKRLSKIDEPFDETAVIQDAADTQVQNQLGVLQGTNFVVKGSLSLSEAVLHLKDLPPDWTPDSNQAWKDYTDILGGLAIPLSGPTGISVKDLLSASRGNWTNFKATLAKAADVTVEGFDRKQMSILSGEIMEMVHNFSRTVIVPVFAGSMIRAGQFPATNPIGMVNDIMEKGYYAGYKAFIGSSKNQIAALLEAERKYVSRIVVIDGLTQEQGPEDEIPLTEAQKAMGDMAGNRAFPVLRETWTAPNGYMVVPLRSEQEMMEEGTLMKHCVGTNYSRTGSSGEYHFFSVRHPDKLNDPRARATLRLMPVSPGSDIKQAEYRSYNNGNVTPECQVAYQHWLATFLRADIDAAGARMDEWRAYRREQGLDRGQRIKTAPEVWADQTGVFLTSEQVRKNLWAEWAQNVMTGWQSETPELIYRVKEIRDLLTDFSPRTADFLVEEAKERKAALEAAKAEGPSP